jgi:hypothetical protein
VEDADDERLHLERVAALDIGKATLESSGIADGSPGVPEPALHGPPWGSPWGA